MNKQRILNEIKRTARENGGAPFGKDRFLQQSGIRENDWFGKYCRWGDALQEAEFSANKLQGAHSEEFLIEKYVGLIQENVTGMHGSAKKANGEWFDLDNADVQAFKRRKFM